jgi:hypothetical protein
MVKLPPRLILEVSSLLSTACGTFSMMTANSTELSILVEKGLWTKSDLKPMAIAAHGPYRVISLEVNIGLDVVGYLSPILKRFAERGICVFANCSFSGDHLIVNNDDVNESLNIINEFVNLCKSHVG